VKTFENKKFQKIILMSALSFDNESGTQAILELGSQLTSVQKDVREVFLMMQSLVSVKPYRKNNNVSELQDDATNTICSKVNVRDAVISIERDLSTKKLMEFAQICNIKDLVFKLRFCPFTSIIFIFLLYLSI
jgi:hypothetical protein